MQCLDTEEINEQKVDRLAMLIEQVLLDTALAVVHQLCQNQKQRLCICYKSDCSMRDDIPF